MMMEAARPSETSVYNYFTRQYITEDKSELHIRRRENLKSHIAESSACLFILFIQQFLSSPNVAAEWLALLLPTREVTGGQIILKLFMVFLSPLR
jgi:hypothetical protein